jgi:hypothetical protein
MLPHIEFLPDVINPLELYNSFGVVFFLIAGPQQRPLLSLDDQEIGREGL